jgi:hypothetical protein
LAAKSNHPALCPCRKGNQRNVMARDDLRAAAPLADLAATT